MHACIREVLLAPCMHACRRVNKFHRSHTSRTLVSESDETICGEDKIRSWRLGLQAFITKQADNYNNKFKDYFFSTSIFEKVRIIVMYN